MTPNHRLTLPLAPPLADGDSPLIPARMVNEWVEDEWAVIAPVSSGSMRVAEVSG